ncbi:hypothetical protein IFM89_019685 [Coptis chinensis]|uniref:RNase H type-1 domain-containing protein n=1 Tax=Coptis chinensis TaxID=261450 RepID=A0A835HN72_9MAGN|nr:hypothetical protein IFM89_019685 [Coptis chinensis]
MLVLREQGLPMKYGPAPKCSQCIWLPPVNQVKINTDGAAQGNPESVEIALSNGWKNIWVESDAAAAVTAFKSDSSPWQLKTRWKECIKRSDNITLSHIWREANLVADKVAAPKNEGESFECSRRPPWIYKWEAPYQCFLRFA